MEIKRTSEITDLIDSLHPHPDDVGTIESSQMLVFIPPDGVMTFNKDECEKLLAADSTVRQLFDALGSPEEATIELQGLELSGSVLETLERKFHCVDEI